MLDKDEIRKKIIDDILNGLETIQRIKMYTKHKDINEIDRIFTFVTHAHLITTQLTLVLPKLSKWMDLDSDLCPKFLESDDIAKILMDFNVEVEYILEVARGLIDKKVEEINRDKRQN